MGIKNLLCGTSAADQPERQGKRPVLWVSVTAAALITLVVLLVVIVKFPNHDTTVELVSVGNLPCGPFIKKTEDTIFVTPVDLVSSNIVPITIQQISVTDVDDDTALFPTIYVVDLKDDMLLESVGYSTRSEFLDRYSDRINPLKYAPDGYLPTEAQKFRSNYICIFLLFDHFPPPQHRVAVTCKYELHRTTMISYTELRRT